MLHAPTSETKRRSHQSSTQSAEPPERQLRLRLGGSARSAWAAGTGIGLRLPSVGARRQQLAGFQSTYGNQAVLRRLAADHRSENDLLAAPGITAAASAPRLQTKLEIGAAGDPLEQEADRMAETVMRMPDRAVLAGASTRADRTLQRACAACEEQGEKEEMLQRKGSDDEALDQTVAPPVVDAALNEPGQPLDPGTRGFFEQRFGYDFSDVRVHTDGTAAASARAVHAHAYTLGNRIVFNSGLYRPHTEQGRALLAHELTHVVQQQESGQTLPTIQRDCDAPDFCKPYPTAAEAAAAEATIRSWYLPFDGAMWGATSRALYERYLSRSPGDSLAPVIFDDPTSDVVDSFATSRDTDNDQDAIIDLIGARLSRAPGPLSDYTPTVMSIANFLSSFEMDNRPINYSNPASIAGHIAGGIGRSDAGDDYRTVWGNVTLEKVPLIGSTGYVSVEPTLHYEVFDAVDFCPGDCGSPAEKKVTVPMSRLEASGEAYDVPFKVTFVPESRSKRFFCA